MIIYINVSVFPLEVTAHLFRKKTVLYHVAFSFLSRLISTLQCNHGSSFFFMALLVVYRHTWTFWLPGHNQQWRKMRHS